MTYSEKPDKNSCPQKYCFFWSGEKCRETYKAFNSSFECNRKNPNAIQDWYEPCEPELIKDCLPLDYFYKCE